MRVMLFVQNDGDKRPKCYGSVAPTIEDDAGGEEWSCHTERQRTAALAPGATYFVVECENAEDGRKIIANAALGVGSSMARVLASGGKR